MKEMGGWSWTQIREAPPDLIEEIYFKSITRERLREERRKKDEATEKAKGKLKSWPKR